jgi:hypothetical protein
MTFENCTWFIDIHKLQPRCQVFGRVPRIDGICKGARVAHRVTTACESRRYFCFSVLENTLRCSGI